MSFEKTADWLACPLSLFGWRRTLRHRGRARFRQGYSESSHRSGHSAAPEIIFGITGTAADISNAGTGAQAFKGAAPDGIIASQRCPVLCFSRGRISFRTVIAFGYFDIRDGIGGHVETGHRLHPFLPSGHCRHFEFSRRLLPRCLLSGISVGLKHGRSIAGVR